MDDLAANMHHDLHADAVPDAAVPDAAVPADAVPDVIDLTDVAEEEEKTYKEKTTLGYWEVYAFDKRDYTACARSDLDAACRSLARYFKAYLKANRKLLLWPRPKWRNTFAVRFREYQRRTYHKKFDDDDEFKFKFNVYDRICALDLVCLELAPNFEHSLLRYIAMYLLPSVMQHKMYYGRTQDLTNIQPRKMVEVLGWGWGKKYCTWYEWREANGVDYY